MFKIDTRGQHEALSKLLCFAGKDEERMNNQARLLESLIGWDGPPWGWLKEPCSSSGSDAGQCGNAFVTASWGHPMISLARQGNAEGILALLKKGSPSIIRFERSAPCNIASLSAKNKTSGVFAELWAMAPDDATRRETWAGWMDGCADALWASGVDEAAAATENLLREGRLPLLEYGVFGSAIEHLIWHRKELDLFSRERAKETLNSMLRQAPPEDWPRDEETDGDGYEYPSLLAGAVWSGADWAIDALLPFYSRDKMEEASKFATSNPDPSDKESEVHRALCLAKIERLLMDSEKHVKRKERSRI